MKNLENCVRISHFIFSTLLTSIFYSSIIVIVFAQVLARYVFNNPISWAEEISRFCFVWIVFLGAAEGIKRGVHLGVDILIRGLPDKAKHTINLCINLMIIVFLFFVVKEGLKMVVINMGQQSPAARIPMGLPYLAIPTGGAIMSIYVLGNIRTFFKLLTKKGQERCF